MSITVEKIRNFPGMDGHSVVTFLNDDNTYSGYCYPLAKYIDDPYFDKPKDYKPVIVRKTYEEIQAEIGEINECESLALPDRKLRKETLDYFNTKVGLSRVDGETPTTIHFPYYERRQLVAYKTKLMEPKRFWAVGDHREAEPFGWQQALEAGAPKLFITEGELDTLALFQMLKDKQAGTKWADLNPAVISLKDGAGNAKTFLAKWAPEINRRFKQVVLVYDMDEAGKKAVIETQLVLPDTIVAELPAKDAGECLMQGFEKGCTSAVLFNATKAKNTRIVFGSTLADAAMEPAQWGLSYPWKGLTDITRGIRRGETIYWGAGVKMGKSELVNALAINQIINHDLPIFLCKPEEPLKKTYKMLVGKAAGRIFHDPRIEFDREAWLKWSPRVADKAIISDVYQFVDWDTLKGDIKYVVVAEGVKDVYIDPITSMSHSLSASETNDFLDEMTAELSAMALNLDFTANIFCHLKAPAQGPDHERGGEVFSTQFAGSRAMMRSANYFFGVQGDRNPELPIDQRNLRKLICLEDREFGASGMVPLHWNWRTSVFTELETK